MHCMDLIAIIMGILGLLIGAAAGAFLAYGKGVDAGVEKRKQQAESLIGSAEQQAKRIMEDADRDAESTKKSAIIEAKDEIQKLRSETDKEIKDRRAELSRQERRMQQKEENLDKKTDNLEKKEETLNQKIKSADEKLKEADSIKKSQMDILERISEFTKDQAKEYIISKLEDDLVHEKAVKVQAYEQLIKDECQEKARSYISLAIAKVAADQVSEAAVSVVPLPNDEMKGRIIGREGRNIRTLETLTGVDLIIDDTPEAITISCFDQIRREVARIALEKLISDGRIHPTRIEEMVEKARREVEYRIKQEGERAVIETNVHGLNHELIKLIGRLKFRTSYRQNVLDHSIEVAKLCGVLASELGVDVGKKYNENPVIIHAVEAHHNDVEPKTVIACIVQAADAISAARPAARSENYESYIKRLQKLEEICTSYDGVEKCFAVQAGREVRIMVTPEVINDEKMVLVARQIAQQIESEMDYPGQIKVNLIRESRVTDYAK